MTFNFNSQTKICLTKLHKILHPRENRVQPGKINRIIMRELKSQFFKIY